MKILFSTPLNFKRKLTSKEEADYIKVLEKGKEKAAGANGKSVLIIPASSLPQKSSNNTGVGNLASEDAQKFFNFAKKYWGINEIQILPMGQYHKDLGTYPIYSGTSMNLGNHVIDIKRFISQTDYERIVHANNIQNRVNFDNVINLYSMHENTLKTLYHNMPENLKSEFLIFKKNCPEIIERKGLYRILRNIHDSYNYKDWGDFDSNLFNEDIVNIADREKRIAELKAINPEMIDFVKFKEFLGEKSLKLAKNELNAKGLKLNGDMLCGFSYDEVWAYPKAFIKDCTNKWNLPMLDFGTDSAEKLFREKIRYYAKNYDGLRIDAAWQYISPTLINTKTTQKYKKEYGDKYIKIIEEEFKKIKGENCDLRDIMYEFAADYKDFAQFSEHGILRPEIKNRVKIYTSQWLNCDNGSAYFYLKNRWNPDEFIIGAANHDTPALKPEPAQINELNRILKIPKEKLASQIDFIKAKLAEPLRAKNNMIFFMNALGMKGQYQGNRDLSLNYTIKVPENYEELYFNALKNGEGFNPMDALEKQFRAQGLDKTERNLFRKIVKYRKILESKHNKTPWIKIGIGVLGASAAIIAALKFYESKD